ncbi:MAG: hypothetical protein ACREGD_02650 [Candidatus Saccharimonadales bacterium]
MTVADLFAWWYGIGWTRVMHGVAARIQGVMDFFSVTLLLGTLFDPFRQIDAGQVRGTPQEQLRAFGNRLFSRIVGFFIRSVTILCGLVSAAVMTVAGLVQLLLWPLLPALPLLGVIAAFAGWTL